MSISRSLALICCLPALLSAHPDHGIPPGKDPTAALCTGNGAFRYTVVPGWGAIPAGASLGPTHGTVLVAPDNRVYLSTDGPLSVVVWEQDGTFVKSIAPECQGFHAMAMRVENGRAFLYGAQNNAYGNAARKQAGQPATPFRIAKIDLDGKLALEIPNPSTADIPGGWNGLTAVTVAPDGSIFAACGYGSQQIHKFDAGGKHLLSFGDKGKEDGKFQTCHGLLIDDRFSPPRLLVADRENRRLVHFDFEGKFLGTHATQLRRPCAMALRGEYLAVAELEARVTILDRNGTPVAFLGDNPDKSQWANFQVKPEHQHDGIFTAPHGLGFADSGDLYVQDWNASGRVTKLQPLR